MAVTDGAWDSAMPESDAEATFVLLPNLPRFNRPNQLEHTIR